MSSTSSDPAPLLSRDPRRAATPTPDPATMSTLCAITHRLTARLPHSSGPRGEQVLARLTAAAVASVPGADYAGLTLHHHGALVSQAPTDSRIRDAENLQVTLADGPCVDAAAPGAHASNGTGAGPVVVVEDFAAELRWARFSPAAAARGLRSLLSFTLAPHRASPGALNLYSTRPHAFDHHAQLIGAAFAHQAAVAVSGAETIADLERALQTRDEIGQAKGILIERFGLTSQQAFELLVESSQQTNTKLAVVAHWLLTETTSRPRQDGADPGPGSVSPTPLAHPEE